MTISITILKVLSAYPEGRASFASLKADLAILGTHEWLARMRTLGRQVGPINLFSHNLATRDANGWAITEVGRALLERLENGEELAPTRPSDPPLLRVAASSAAPKKSDAVRPAVLKVVA